MSPDPNIIRAQQKLLAHHRQWLAFLFEQQAKFGVYTPPHIIIDIREAQDAIRSIKAELREGSIQVEDEPNDEAPPPADTNQTAGAGPRVQSTINVTENKGTVIGTQIINQAALAPALHQLRAPVGDFVGRADEIDRLVSALSTVSGGAATISGVRGMGGIGKTQLAYKAAMQLKDAFPTAQLLVELRGASSSPLSSEQALQAIIHAYEREAKLPDDLSQLQGIYHSLLTGKKVLILADDARDAAQVRPLLPPAGCALLLTSRNRFGLPGMITMDLEVLSPAEAEKLLLEVCPRIGEHAGELAQRCGYLPLALRVSAGLLKENDSRDVGRYLEQLRAERLKHLSDPDDVNDPQASVEASLRLSYDALEPGAQSALCQLSVFPTSFNLAAPQGVVEIAGDITETLDLLRRRSLLEWDAAVERFSLHDLVRAFAAAQLEDADAVRVRHAGYYARVAELANNLYRRGGESILVGLALFDRERVQIDAGWTWARQRAGSPETNALLLAYADATAYIGDLRYNKRHERIPQLEAMLEAARRLGDRRAEGTALGNLGVAYANLGEVRTAISFYEQRLAIARELGDRRGEGQALGNLGTAYIKLGKVRTAISFYEQRLAIARELGDRDGEGKVLGNLGVAYNDLGQRRTAISFHEQHLALAREIGDRRGESISLGNLGVVYADLGEFRTAISFYERRLAIARELGDRRAGANALTNLGNAYFLLGEVHQAITYYEQALAIAHEIGGRSEEANVSRNLFLVYERQGDLVRAAELMQVSVDYLSEMGHPDAKKHAAYLEELRQRLAASQSPPPAEKPDEV